jgi:hypothetical protein
MHAKREIWDENPVSMYIKNRLEGVKLSAAKDAECKPANLMKINP